MEVRRSRRTALTAIVGLTGLAARALLLGVVDLLDGSWSGLVFLAGGLFIGALVMRTALRKTTQVAGACA
jgi:hypothetical protein